jgi:alkylation response protein AidB-like acyl-CoA dehydrogenase
MSNAERVRERVAAAAALAPLIRAHADENERGRRLCAPVVDALHDADLFRLGIPEYFGGGGLDLVQAMPVLEEVAAADGSTGWNLAIGVGSLGIACMLDDDGAIEEIVKAPRALAAASVNPLAMRLQPVDGGYRLRGRMQYASGVHQSSWLMAGGLVVDGEKPRIAPDGFPVMRGAFFRTSEANVLDTWHVNGLAGTGSHDVDVEDVFVPAVRTYDLFATAPKRHEPLATMPLVSRLGVALVAVGVGILRRAIDELAELAAAKPQLVSGRPVRERANVQIDVARACGLLDAARAHVASVAGELVGRVRAGETLAPVDLARARLCYVTATEQLLQGVELVRRAAGMNALKSGSAFERCARDLHALSQHFALSSSHLERIGKIRLGMDPGPGPI